MYVAYYHPASIAFIFIASTPSSPLTGTLPRDDSCTVRTKTRPARQTRHPGIQDAASPRHSWHAGLAASSPLLPSPPTASSGAPTASPSSSRPEPVQHLRPLRARPLDPRSGQPAGWYSEPLKTSRPGADRCSKADKKTRMHISGGAATGPLPGGRRPCVYRAGRPARLRLGDHHPPPPPLVGVSIDNSAANQLGSRWRRRSDSSLHPGAKKWRRCALSAGLLVSENTVRLRDLLSNDILQYPPFFPAACTGGGSPSARLPVTTVSARRVRSRSTGANVTSAADVRVRTELWSLAPTYATGLAGAPLAAPTCSPGQRDGLGGERTLSAPCAWRAGQLPRPKLKR